MKSILSSSKMYGTNSERLAMNIANTDMSILFYETDSNSEYEWTGSEWIQKSINGAACVITGSSGQAHNRNLAAVAITTWVAATNEATWVAPVTDLEITVPATAGCTGVLAVYGAPSDATASAWLADAGGMSSDVAYDRLLPGTTTTRRFTSGIQRVDFLALGAATPVTIGAV